LSTCQTCAHYTDIQRGRSLRWCKRLGTWVTAESHSRHWKARKGDSQDLERDDVWPGKRTVQENGAEDVWEHEFYEAADAEVSR
jgi:hypothetical protein